MKKILKRIYHPSILSNVFYFSTDSFGHISFTFMRLARMYTVGYCREEYGRHLGYVFSTSKIIGKWSFKMNIKDGTCSLLCSKHTVHWLAMKPGRQYCLHNKCFSMYSSRICIMQNNLLCRFFLPYGRLSITKCCKACSNSTRVDYLIWPDWCTVCLKVDIQLLFFTNLTCLFYLSFQMISL